MCVCLCVNVHMCVRECVYIMYVNECVCVMCKVCVSMRECI